MSERKKRIEEAASKFNWQGVVNRLRTSTKAFKLGAEWADANPPAPSHTKPKDVPQNETQICGTSERDESALERSVRYWISKVYCPYKAPELRSELALEAFDEFKDILTPAAKEEA